MRELKRVFLNKIWLGAAVFLAICNIFIYIQWQKTALSGGIDRYASYHNALWTMLTSCSTEQGLALLEEENNSILGWLAAKQWVQIAGDTAQAKDDELLRYYREMYPNFDQMVRSIQSGSKVDIDVAMLTAVSRWTDCLTAASAYSIEVQSVLDRAAKIRNNPLFGKPGTFAYRNAEKTEADYRSIAAVELEIVPDDVIRSLLEGKGAVIFSLCLMAVTVVWILEPRRLGLRDLEKSCPNGRMILAGWRIIAIILASGLITLLMQGGVLAVGMLLYRQPLSIDAPVQSIPLLRFWGAPDTVGDFLLWYFCFSAAGICVAGMLLLLVLSLFKSLSMGVTAYSVGMLLEANWFLGQGVNDSLYPLSAINIFRLLLPAQAATRYYNYNLFGFPISERTALNFIAGLAVLGGAVAGVGLSISSPQRLTDSRIKNTIKGVINRTASLIPPLPGWIYESRKLLHFCGGILFLVLGVLGITQAEIPLSTQNQQEFLLTEYIRTYAGPIEKQTYAVIDKEREAADRIYAEAKISGIDGGTLEYYRARCWALDTLQRRYEELMDMDAAVSDRLQLIDEQPLERIYGEAGRGVRLWKTSVALLTLCLMLPFIFYIEQRYKMNILIQTTDKGRSILWRRKIFLATQFAVLLWTVWTVHELGQFFSIGGSRESMYASGMSLLYWNDRLGNISLAAALFFWYGLRLVGLLAACWVIACISTRQNTFLLPVGESIFILLIPTLLAEQGVSFLRPFSWAIWLAEENLAITGTDIICIVVWSIAGAVALTASYHQWKRCR